ncbi:DUF6273 domain-containing protein [Christensenella timonensis]|uniref:DUF6273 domain-containing protein n=1 Tax=Christensenella timonensis TaxID=1816678 RepID=UPI00082EA69B|nr:DUF6273 domain-containing protein [Christensenella timonensis]
MTAFLLAFALIFSIVPTAMAAELPTQISETQELEPLGSEDIANGTNAWENGVPKQLPKAQINNLNVVSSADVKAAADADGRIQIDSYEKFKRIGHDPAYPLDASYIQTADFKIPDNTTHTPIGDGNTPFTGTYDGGGHTITGGQNLEMNVVYHNDYGYAVGLFGSVQKNARLCNFTVSNVEFAVSYTQQDISGNDVGYTGIVMGADRDEPVIENIHVQNCGVSVTSDSVRLATGGFAGYAAGTIKDCTVNNTFVSHTGGAGATQYLGGMFGIGNGGTAWTVNNCHVNGGHVEALNAESGSILVSGFSGSTGGVYSDCSTSADLYADTSSDVSLGGFFSALAGNSHITNCISTSKISYNTAKPPARLYLGGFLASASSNTAGMQLENNLAINSIEYTFAGSGAADGGNIGGFVGRLSVAPSASTFKGNYYFNNGGGNLQNRTGKLGSYIDGNEFVDAGIHKLDTTAEVSPFPTELKFTSLNAPANIYSMGDIFGYTDVSYSIKDGTDPQNAFSLTNTAGDTSQLTQTKAVAPNELPTVVVTYNRVGAASIIKEIPVTEAVIAVPDYETFAKIGQDAAYPLSGSYLQTADWTIPDGTTHTPVGNATTPFLGTYDGGGRIITGSAGFKINKAIAGDGSYEIGIFGHTAKATIKNLTIKDIHVEQTETDIEYCGILAGFVQGTVESVTIVDSSIKVNITNTAIAKNIIVGGLIGMGVEATMNNCVVKNTNVDVTPVIGGGNYAYTGLLAGVVAIGNINNSVGDGGTVKVDNAAYPGGTVQGSVIGQIDSNVKIANTHCYNTQIIRDGNATTNFIGGFVAVEVGDSTTFAIRNCSTTATSTANGTDGVCGGFIGRHDITAANMENAFVNNTFTASVGYTNKVGSFSATQDGAITDNMIKLVSDPTLATLTIQNLTTSPTSTQWLNAAGTMDVSAEVTSTLSDAKYVFIASSEDADSSSALMMLSANGDRFTGTIPASAMENIIGSGTLYLCAQTKNTSGAQTARASQPITVLRDPYSPRLSGINKEDMQDGTINISLSATDSQSGVAGVYAAASDTDYTAGQVALTYNDTTKKWSAALPGGTWYLYAKDNAGNISAAPEKIEAAVSDWIPVYDYDDFKKIGVEKGYPLSGKYIQMADFKIPDSTVHTPIGNADAPFAGIYNGNNKTITGGRNMTWNSVVSKTGNLFPAAYATGLFGVMDGKVSSLSLDGFTIINKSAPAGQTYIASSLAGCVGGAVENVTAQNITIEINSAATESDRGGRAGALAGIVMGSSASLKNCLVENISIDIVTPAAMISAGGLCAMLIDGAYAIDCTAASGTINAGACQTTGVGGLIGHVFSAKVENCYSSVDSVNAGLTSPANLMSVGGLIGLQSDTYAASSTINHCVSSGNITAVPAYATTANAYRIGGFIGTIAVATGTPLASNNAAYGKMNITGNSGGVGSFFGVTNCTTVSFAGNVCVNNGFGKSGSSYPVAGLTDSHIRFVATPEPSVTDLNMQELNRDYNISSAAEAFGYTAKWSVDNPKFELNATAGDSVSVRQMEPLSSPDEAANIMITYQKGTTSSAATVSLKGVIGVPDYDTFKLIGKGNYGLERGYYQTQDFTIPNNTVHTPIGSYAAPFTGTYDGGNHTVKAGVISYNLANIVQNDLKGASLFGTVSGGLQNINVEGLHYTSTAVEGQYVATIVSSLRNGGRLLNSHVRNCVLNIDTVSYGGLIMSAIVGHAFDNAYIEGCSANNVTLESKSKVTGDVIVGGVAGVNRSSTIKNSTANTNIDISEGSITQGSTIVGGFVGDAHDNGQTIDWLIQNCSADGTIAVNGLVGTTTCGVYLGGFAGHTQQNFMPASPKIVNSRTNTTISSDLIDGSAVLIKCGGFIGGNDMVTTKSAAAYSGNTYTASCKYPNRVSANSTTPDTGSNFDDSMIKLIDAPITISNLMLDPPEGAWANASQGVGVQADVKTTSDVTGTVQVFVAADANETNPANGTEISKSTNLFMPNTYKLAGGADGLFGSGAMYLIAQDADDPTARRATYGFNILRDLYSPRMENLSANKNNAGGFDVSLDVTDSQSGMGYVFASKDASNPAEAGRVQLAKASDNTNAWSGSVAVPATGEKWYIYAVDKAGNMSTAPLVVDDSVAGRIEIWTYDDFKKIGVDPAYPLSGNYIQMADFVIPDGTTHTPIGDSATPFTGTYDGGSHTITGGRNMTWNTVGEKKAVGLFGYTSGVVKNLDIKEFDLAVGNIELVGIVAGRSSGKLRNVHVKDSSVTISTMESINLIASGALAGDIQNGVVTGCTATNVNVSVDASGTTYICAGGLFGGTNNSEAIENCAVTGGAVDTNGTQTVYIGGFVGYASASKYSNCNTSADVTDIGGLATQLRAGGFVGSVQNSVSTFNTCTTTGKVTSNGNNTVSYFGGFAGWTLNAALRFENCSTTGAMSYAGSDTKYCAGFVGVNWMNAAAVKNAFKGNTYVSAQYPRVGSGSTTNETNAPDDINDTTIHILTDAAPTPSPVNIKTLNTPVTVDSVGDDFGYYGVKWEFEYPDSVREYFTLSAAEGQQVKVTQTKACPAPAEVTLKATYSKVGYNDIAKTVKVRGVVAVPDYDTFKKIGADTQNGYSLDRSYYQTQDFAIPANTVHTPIGNHIASFSGIYDGGNHTVTGGEGMSAVPTTGNSASVYTMGLFGHFTGTLKNWNVKNVSIANTSKETNWGGVVIGDLINGTTENVRVSDSKVEIYTSANNGQAGALVGISHDVNSIIRNCTAKNNDVKVNFNNASYSAFAGGLVGCNQYGAQIYDSSVIGGNVSVNGSAIAIESVGGLVGESNSKFTIDNCHVDGTIVSLAGKLAATANLGGFIGSIDSDSAGQTVTNCSTTAQSSINGTAGRGGGFIGYHVMTTANAQAAFADNTFSTSVGYANKVGASSATVDANISDSMIRLIDDNNITISNITLDPAADIIWINGNQKVGVKANVAKSNGVTGDISVFISSDPNAVSGTNMRVTPDDGVYELAQAAGLMESGTQYVIAKNADNSMRASAPFTILRDIYSPHISNVQQQTTQDRQNVSAAVIDSQSGVAKVYASQNATNAKPEDAGSTAFDRVAAGDIWSGVLSEGTWYIYAIDRVGNFSDVPIKVDVKASGWIPIYSYADFKKIGVDALYPLDGKYIQMNDFKIPDGTEHTPVGNNNAGEYFTGIYNGNHCTITGGKNMTWKVVGSAKLTGLFGYIGSGTVMDLSIRKVAIESTDVLQAGILAAAMGSAKISGVSVSDSAIKCDTNTTEQTFFGGLTGSVSASSFEKCTVDDTNIETVNAQVNIVRVGGFIGYGSQSTFTDCAVNGGTFNAASSKIANGHSILGGFTAGGHDVVFRNCSTSADVHNGGSYNVYTGGFGGLVSKSTTGELVFENCTASGNITTEDASGLQEAAGFVSTLATTASKAGFVKPLFQNCAALGKFVKIGSAGLSSVISGSFNGRNSIILDSTETADYAGVFVNNVCTNTTYGKVALTNAYNATNNADIDRGITLLATPQPSVSILNIHEMDKDYTVQGAAQAFGYTAHWSIDNPKFQLSNVVGDNVNVRQLVPLANGNEKATLTVTYSKAGQADITAAVDILGVIGVPDFAAFEKVGKDTANGYNLDRGYLQTADITIPDNTVWTPIAPTEATKFSGIYDGGNYTLYARNISFPATGNVYPSGDISASALFGCVYGTVQNITVSGLKYMAANLSRNQEVAPLVAFLGTDAKLINAHSKDCTLDMGAYTGYLVMGGLVAEMYDSYAENCSSDNVTLIGGTTGTGGNAFIGGFLGSMDTCTVKSSTANANITLNGSNSGQVFLGGFGGAGNSTNGPWLFENCNASGSITANETFNGANVQGIGGFIGSVWMPTTCAASIKDCSTVTHITSTVVDGSVTNVKCGGFIGNNGLVSLTDNVYSNNTYTAACKYSNKVGKTSSVPDASITDSMIRLLGDDIEITDIQQYPGYWTNAADGRTVTATIKANGTSVIDETNVFVSDDPLSITNAVPMTRIAGTDTFTTADGALKLGGKMYVVAKDSNSGGAPTYVEFESRVDAYSPAVESITVTENIGDAQDVAAKVRDSQSGVSRVFASRELGAADGVELELDSTAEADGSLVTYSVKKLAAGDWYLYAADNVGNLSAEPTPFTVRDIEDMSIGDISQYWDGLGAGESVTPLIENNRAMVWFGSYNQTGEKESPVLWRTLESGSSETMLMTEYVPAAVRYDDLDASPVNLYWANFNGINSGTRAWMNNLQGRTVDYASNGFLNNAFSETEKALTLNTIVKPPDKDGEAWGYGIPTSDKLFLLNSAQATDPKYYKDAAARKVLATTDTKNKLMADGYTSEVTADGYIHYYIPEPFSSAKYNQVSIINQAGNIVGATASLSVCIHGVRPATNLDSSSIMLVAAGNDGSAPRTSGTLTETTGSAPDSFDTVYGSDSQTFRVFERVTDGSLTMGNINGDVRTALAGDMLDVSYEGATRSKIGADIYAGVLLVNKVTHEKYQARLQKITDENGTLQITLPSGLASGSYAMFLWAENEQQRKASQPVKFTVNIGQAKEETAPVLSNGTQVPAAGTKAPTKNITITASDASGISNIFVATNPGAMSGISMTANGGNVYESQTLYTNDTYYVIAYDVFGNRSVSGAIPVSDIGMSDGNPPVITNGKQETDELKAEKNVTADVMRGSAEITQVYVTERDNSTGMETGDVEMQKTGSGDAYQTVSALKKNGVYYVVAYDAEGNRAEVRVLVDKIELVSKDDISTYYDGIVNGMGTAARAMVWFGGWPQSAPAATANEPMLWRTLESDAGSITLLSEYAPYTSYFDKDTGNYNQFWYNNANKVSSDIRAWMNGGAGMVSDGNYSRYIKSDTTYPSFYINAFGAEEKGLILPTKITTEAGNAAAWGGLYGNNGQAYSVFDKVFALSAGDTKDVKYFAGDTDLKTIITPNASNNGANNSYTSVYGTMTGKAGYHYNNYGYWFTRSPYDGTAHQVHAEGYTSASGYIADHNANVTNNDAAARPAINLDSSAVVFTAASNTGGSPAVLGEDTALVKAAGDAPSSFALAYGTDSQSFRVFRRGGQEMTLTAGTGYGGVDTVTFDYTGATYGRDNYISAMLVNTATKDKWTGRIAKVTAADGSVTVKLPVNVGAEGYRLYIWNESEADKNTSEPMMYALDQMGPEIVSVTNLYRGAVNEEWTNGEKTVEAVVRPRSTAVDDAKVYIADSIDAEPSAATNVFLSKKAGAENTYEATKDDWVNGGQKYLIAYDTAGMRSAFKFTLYVDKYSPNISNVMVGNEPSTYVQYVTAQVIDTQSGVNPSRVFASQEYKNAVDGILFTQTVGSNQYTAMIPAGTWYIYAVDNIGNITDEMSVYKIEVTGTEDPSIGDISQYYDGISNATGALDEANRAMVWFGNFMQGADGTRHPLLWRTLESTTGSTILMTEYNLISGNVHNNTASGNEYILSNVRGWLNSYLVTDFDFSGADQGFLNNLNDANKNLIMTTALAPESSAATTLYDKVFAISNTELYRYYDGDITKSRAMGTDWAKTTSYSGGKLEDADGYSAYWLRTPSTESSRLKVAGAINFSTEISVESSTIGLRPAVNLDPNQVILTASGTYGDAPLTVGSTLTKVTGAAPDSFSINYGADSQSFRVFERDVNLTLGTTTAKRVIAEAGNTVRIDYFGASASDQNYFNMLLVDKTSKAKWQGRIAPITATNGYAEFILPADLPDGSYAAFIWNENEGTKKASEPVKFSVNIGSIPEDTQPPVIANEAQQPADAAQVKKVAADITDNIGVTNAFVSMDQNALAGTSMTPVGSGNQWESQNIYYEGTYYIIAYDAAGNRAVSGPVVVSDIANPNIPVITNVKQVDNAVANSRAVQADVAWSSGATGQRVFVASDPNATTGIELVLSAGDTYVSETGVAKNGTWYIIAVDSNGNRASAPVYVDKVSTVLPTDVSTYYDGIVNGSATDKRAMVWFGNYPQSSASANEPILWRTVESTTGNVLMMSEYLLAGGNWNNAGNNNLYASESGSSHARAWLNSTQGWDYDFSSGTGINGGFLNTAFTNPQKNMVVETVVEGESSTAGTGKTVFDKLFPISYQEAVSSVYFPTSGSRAAIATPVSKTQDGNWHPAGGLTGTYWMLRTPDSTTNSNIYRVNDTGQISTTGPVNTTWSIRPALNLDPSKIVLTAANNAGGAPAATTNITTTALGSAPANFAATYGTQDNESFRVFERGGNGVLTAQISHLKGHTEGTIRYSSASYEAGQTYIAGLLVNKNTKEKYAARLIATDASGYGTFDITLPADVADHPENYALYIWNENEQARTTSDIVIFDGTTEGLKSDREPPVIKSVFQIPDNDTWEQSRKIGATALDAETGVLKLFYTDRAQGAESGTDMEWNAIENCWESKEEITTPGTYYVYGIDKAGNVTKTGTPVELKKIDAIAPEILGYTLDSAGTLSVTVKDTGGSGIAKVTWSRTESGAGTQMRETAEGSGVFEGTVPTDGGAYWLSATDGAGNVTKLQTSGVYLIYTEEDLRDIINHPDGMHIQKNDITLTSEWIPVGSADTPFTGSYDGGGYLIYGLRAAGEENTGLFGVAKDATLKNIGVENIEIKGGNNAGALVGLAKGSMVIENCDSGVGSVTGSSNAGGLAGSVIAGDGCAAHITGSYSKTDVTGGMNTGGLIGFAAGSTSGDTTTIQTSYSKGRVSSEAGSFVGGVIGQLTDASLADAYATGAVAASGTANIGGVAGGLSGKAQASGCYWNASGNGAVYGIGAADGGGSDETGKTGKLARPDMLGKTFGLPTGDAGYTLVRTGYPDITANPDKHPTDVYYIRTEEDLKDMANHPYAVHIQLNNIELTGNWTPVGSASEPFSGVFDGGGYALDGLVVSGTNNLGLFGYVSGADIKNVRLENVTVTGNQYVGALAGRLDSSIGASSITNCAAVSGSITGMVFVGGLIGYTSSSNASVIDGCYNLCGVSAQSGTQAANVGGIAGYLYGGAAGAPTTVKNSYNKGNIATTSTNSSQNTGGIVGNAGANTRIEGCYNIGSIQNARTSTYTGGILGNRNNVTTTVLINNYWSIDASVVTRGTGGVSAAGSEKATEAKKLTSRQMRGGDLFGLPEDAYEGNAAGYPEIRENREGQQVYEVASEADLAAMAQRPYAMYVQTGDIAVTSTFWNPVGNANAPFTGSFDGRGYAVSDVKMPTGTGTNRGLFGYVSGADIANVNVRNAVFVGGSNIGGIAGYVTGETNILNSDVTGTVTAATASAGGIAGNVVSASAHIEGCYSKAAVTAGTGAGGIAGSVGGAAPRPAHGQ